MRVGNPYLCFATHTVTLVLRSFKRKHFRSFQFDTRSRHLWGGMKASKAAVAHSVGVGESSWSWSCAEAADEEGPWQSAEDAGDCQQGRTADGNFEMVNDIIRVWWECHGMPTVLQDRVVAKYVRRMLRAYVARGAA